MNKKDNKNRLFEMMSKIDDSFKTNKNFNNDETQRPLYDIAEEIRKDWGSKIFYGAKPYLDAMSSLSSIDDNYGMDSAESIVLYFLSNASSWRGETAKRIKGELKKMAGLKENVESDNI